MTWKGKERRGERREGGRRDARRLGPVSHRWMRLGTVSGTVIGGKKNFAPESAQFARSPRVTLGYRRDPCRSSWRARARVGSGRVCVSAWRRRFFPRADARAVFLAPPGAIVRGNALTLGLVMFGGAIFPLAFAFSLTGLALGFAVVVTVALLNDYTCCLLLRAARRCDDLGARDANGSTLSFEELARFCGSGRAPRSRSRASPSSYSSSAPAAAVSPSSARLADARCGAGLITGGDDPDAACAPAPAWMRALRPGLGVPAPANAEGRRRRRRRRAHPPRPRPALRTRPRHHQPRPRGRRRTRAPPRARRRRRLAIGDAAVSRSSTTPPRSRGVPRVPPRRRRVSILGYAFYVHPVLLQPMLKEMTAKERAEASKATPRKKKTRAGRKRRRQVRRRRRDDPPSRRNRYRDFRVGRRRSRVARVVGGFLGCFFRRHRLASFLRRGVRLGPRARCRTATRRFARRAPRVSPTRRCRRGRRGDDDGGRRLGGRRRVFRVRRRERCPSNVVGGASRGGVPRTIRTPVSRVRRGRVRHRRSRADTRCTATTRAMTSCSTCVRRRWTPR